MKFKKTLTSQLNRKTKYCAHEMQACVVNKRRVLSLNREASLGSPIDEHAFIVIRACRSSAVSLKPQYL